jgi:acetyl/propionyl-CoA carboxylase alpha subunit/acetyl-CoA carboxylase carboxyltransferase component
MNSKRLLIANRGEIAIRIAEAAAELGLASIAIYSEDDARALHIKRADEARGLPGSGPAAYLDAERILTIAHEADCGAIHPGYGFLSENADFARRCAEEGITFIGPRPDLLELFGDKTRARTLAAQCGVPILEGSDGPANLTEIQSFFQALGPDSAIIIKAIAGGGGRGMRVVRHFAEIEGAYNRCQSEARASFGNSDLYAERFLPMARHIEVQILGDRDGRISDRGERECTIQRRHQKLVEIAPSPSLSNTLRARLIAAARRMAESVNYNTLGTFEFLVEGARNDDSAFAFIEANPRLQVEHTITEEVSGVDLVKAQIGLAFGRSLKDLGLMGDSQPRGFAIELRINAESMGADGITRPSGGVISVFEPPSGPGIRVDSCAYAGHQINQRFDSLIAKLIVHSPSRDFSEVVNRAYRALCRFRIEGVATNLPFLQALLKHPEFIANNVHTGFVEEHMAALAAPGSDHRRLYFDRSRETASVGTKVDSVDPLAVLTLGKSDDPIASPPAPIAMDFAHHSIPAPEGTVAIKAPMQGTVLAIGASEGDSVAPGQELIVMEAMKMEHVIAAPFSGVVRQITVNKGDTIAEGHPLLFMEEGAGGSLSRIASAETDIEMIRPDLAEVLERHEVTHDGARPEAVARRRKTGQRTARENVEDICDPGSFVEYGALGVAAQRRRRSMEDLIKNTPADGMITGHATVNAGLFGPERAHCVVLAYDFTVLAGTQGHLNHRKKDRMFQLARELRIPLILFAEGGGGRPGDTDGDFSSRTFHDFPKLSGLVPMIGIVSGRCFAGNASLLGCCDVVIATANSNIGMGGPAMIESGGLGVFRPEQIGPMNVQVPSGVVDVAVANEAEAVIAARKYLAYFQGSISQFECADQRRLSSIIPENRRRVYDIREVVNTLADTDSVLELRPHFGRTMVTALIRIEGRPIGLIANDPMHLSGAIDSDGSDKGARFITLCDAFDIPLLFLCDTPGIMVGPEIEKTALVRHSSRMFLAGANVEVPFLKIVLRKAYGLGAIAMSGGADDAAVFTVAWPTGEFGPMALEGAAKLGYRNELAAIADPQERKRRFDEMVASLYQRGKALNLASHFAVDDVIDPADSRRWISAALRSTPPPARRTTKKYPFIDAW